MLTYSTISKIKTTYLSLNMNENYQGCQYLSDRNAATPPLIQISSFSFVLSSINMTKLVEWPVVLSVPALETTL